MDIHSLLKRTTARIILGHRWLVYDSDAEDGWAVYEAKPYAKNTKLIIQTGIEVDAVNALIGD